MDPVEFVEHAKPKVEKPVFVEGLPGIGNVGKLAAQHLVDTLSCELWLDIYSHDFPPQVMVEEGGTVHLVRNQVWSAPDAVGGRDLLIMTGDYQPLTSPGQYALVEGVLDHVEGTGCTELYTLGGYGTGGSVEKPEVLGAATDADVVARLEKLGVQFREDEPAGGIIGISGLLLGMGMRRGMHGACLMGETSGFMVDHDAARAVLDMAGKILGGKIATDDLEEKAQELDRIAKQLSEGEALGGGREPEMHYIG